MRMSNQRKWPPRMRAGCLEFIDKLWSCRIASQNASRVVIDWPTFTDIYRRSSTYFQSPFYVLSLLQDGKDGTRCKYLNHFKYVHRRRDKILWENPEISGGKSSFSNSFLLVFFGLVSLLFPFLHLVSVLLFVDSASRCIEIAKPRLEACGISCNAMAAAASLCSINSRLRKVEFFLFRFSSNFRGISSLLTVFVSLFVSCLVCGDGITFFSTLEKSICNQEIESGVTTPRHFAFVLEK